MKRHLAEFNLGILKYDWDDPRLADFADNLDRVNTIAARSPGFVWRLPDADMEAGQNGPMGHPRMASTLSVWEDGDSLGQFVWNTLHKRFFDRRHEWYDPSSAIRLVLWWVDPGSRPGFKDAMTRLRDLETNGDSDAAFGWDYLKENS